MFKLLKNNRGSLVIVMIVITVLVILGVAMLGISISETRQVKIQEIKMQAYYIARSGAEATAERIITDNDQKIAKYLENHKNTVINSNVSLFPDEPNSKFVVNAIMDSNAIIKLTSTATITSQQFGDISASAILNLDNMQSRGLLAVDDIDISGFRSNPLHPESDVESTGGEVTGEDADWLYNSIDYSGRPLIKVTPPTGLPIRDSIDANNGETIIISENGQYNFIKTKPTGVIEFNTTGKDFIKIVTDTIEIKGSYYIKGNGVVYLYILDGNNNEIKTSTSYDNLSSQFFVYLEPNTKLTIKTGGRPFYGHIYGPEASVDLGAGADLYGSVVAYTITASGSVSMFHEPLLITPEGYPTNISRYRREYWE